MQKVAVADKDKRALAKQFSQNQQGFDYSEENPDEPPTLKRDTVLSRFMPTSRRLVQFSDGNVADPTAKIVYIDGAFDLFHVGHIEILKVSSILVTCCTRPAKAWEQVRMHVHMHLQASRLVGQLPVVLSASF